MTCLLRKLRYTHRLAAILLLMLCMTAGLTGCTGTSGNGADTSSDAAFSNGETDDSPDAINSAPADDSAGGSHTAIAKDGSYTTKDDVALYLYTYGTLPGNFITKKEAQSLGWPGGSLEPYAPGKCIGGDYFGNYEELLPEQSGRDYHECDIDTLGQKSRGAKRIVYSNDGLIYYTGDHYASFELLYGEPSD